MPLLAAAFGAGIFCAYAFGVKAPVPLLICLLFGALSLASSRPVFSSAFLCLAFFFAGAFSFSVADAPPPADSLQAMISAGKIASGDPVVVRGTVGSGPELLPGGRSFGVEVGSVGYKGFALNAKGKIRVYVAINDPEAAADYAVLRLRPGSPVEVAALITREERFNNPGGSSFLEYLDREGIDAVATVKSPLLVERTGGDGFRLSAVSWEIRNSLIRQVLETLGQPAAGMVAASVFGNRHFLEKGSAEVYRAGGTFHVLVVSGLHVTIVGGFVFLVLSAAGARRSASAASACVAVWAFVMLSGGGTPVVRAAMMFTFIASAHVFARNATQINALGAAALVILVADPKALFNPSFQLTVAAVAALAGAAFPLIGRLRAIGSWSPSVSTPLPPRSPLLVRGFCEFLYWDQRVWEIRQEGTVWECGLFKSAYAVRFGGGFFQKVIRGVFEALTVSAILQVCLLPLQVFYFHRIAPAGILLNLAAGVVFVIQTGTAFGALLLSAVSDALAEPFTNLTEAAGAGWIAFQSAFTESIGMPSRVPVYSGKGFAVYPLYALALAAAVIWMNSVDPYSRRPGSFSAGFRRKVGATLAAMLVIFGAAIVFHPFSEPLGDGRLTAHFIDVGQGDSTFVTFPDGTTMLIDGGGRRRFPAASEQEGIAGFERDIRGIGEAVVSEFLWEHGYSSIDLVVLTHGDADHINGLLEVIRNFRVGRILVGVREPSNPEFVELEKEALKRGIPVESVSEGGRFGIAGVQGVVLNPPYGGISEKASDNDRSVVLRLSFGVRGFLFTGDIERGSETRLTGLSGIRADVVKVAHHGSRTSSSEAFVSAVDAEYAVIPVGRRSQFGHPHPEVVERWKVSGAGVLTTGNAGTVTISTDGSLLEVSTFLPDR